MDTPSASMRALARQLLAASEIASGPHVHEAVVVIERLRICLVKLTGDEGFTSLLKRALVLSSAHVPSLRSVKIDAAGRVDGLEHFAADSGTGALGEEAAVAITTHLLGLLVVFIGKSLTLRLLRQSWPDTRLTFEDREADQ